MNWKQIICLLIGIVVAGSLLLYPPVSIAMMSLAWLAGDTNAEPMKHYVTHRFMPEGGLRAINWMILCVQWSILAVIDAFLIYKFRNRHTKSKDESFNLHAILFLAFWACTGFLSGMLWTDKIRLIAPIWFTSVLHILCAILGLVIGFCLIHCVNIYKPSLFLKSSKNKRERNDR
jgi:hypothetical protein